MTLEQQNKILRRAKEIYRKKVDESLGLDHLPTGICYAIHWAIFLDTGKAVSPDEIELLIPSILKIKPIDKSFHDYWWDREDFASRVEALDIMIALTDK